MIYTKRNNGDTNRRLIINENKIEEILKKYCIKKKTTKRL